MKSKRGQIAIFVIFAIFLVVVIALFFLIDRKPEISRGQDFDNPESFIDGCVKKATEDLIDIMLPQGGFVNPRDFKVYQNNRVAYLCKNINYYGPCVNQYPIYLKTIVYELERELESKVGQCFALLEEELGNRNYDISGGNLDIKTELKPDVVEINVIRDFTMSKEGIVRNFDNFRVLSKYPVYDLGFIANEIVTQEARLCYFSTDGFMLTYPRYDIIKYSFSDGTKIYSVKDKNTDKVLNLAIRGCVIPAGF